MKTCTHCGETKEESAFYRNAATKDGLAWDCRDCRRAYVRAYRKVNPKKRREYERRYRVRHPEKVRQSSYKYYRKNRVEVRRRREERQLTATQGTSSQDKSDKEQQKAREYGARYRAKHPEKLKACNAANRALAAGCLLREPCEMCDDPRSVMHHPDYTKPLQVKWLCRKCHRQVHTILRIAIEAGLLLA